LDDELDTRILAPEVQHPGVAETVRPRHTRRSELLPASQNGLGRRVRLKRIEVAFFAHADGFGLAVLDDVDAPKPLGPVAAGKPEVRYLDAALGAVDAQHVVEVHEHRT